MKLQQTTFLKSLPLSSCNIRLGISCESSAKQTIHMKYQVLYWKGIATLLSAAIVCCSSRINLQDMVLCG